MPPAAGEQLRENMTLLDSSIGEEVSASARTGSSDREVAMLGETGATSQVGVLCLVVVVVCVSAV